MNYLTKSVEAIGQFVGLIVGEGHVRPCDAVVQSDSIFDFTW